MSNTRRLNALLWTANALMIIVIVAFAFQYLVFAEHRTWSPAPPLPVTCGGAPEGADAGALCRLHNPLRPDQNPPLVRFILLIGTDRVLGDPDGITAYLELPARKLNVNAYRAEPVLDSTGRELAELAGWRLKSVTSKSALFSTPKGDVTLQLVEGTASMAALPAGPDRVENRMTSQDDVRSALNEATDLYKQGRLAESRAKFDEAFRMKPSADVVYALIRRMGEDVFVSMMTSKDEKTREVGYRLFELAKPGGERIRSRKANA
jgi:hypothetical protein